MAKACDIMQQLLIDSLRTHLQPQWFRCGWTRPATIGIYLHIYIHALTPILYWI